MGAGSYSYILRTENVIGGNLQAKWDKQVYLLDIVTRGFALDS